MRAFQVYLPGVAIGASVLLFLACENNGAPTDDGGGGAGGDDGEERRQPCATDAQCDNELLCDGAETCEEGVCVPGESLYGDDEECDEEAAQRRVQCELTADEDGDGALAVSCGGDDCDDSDPDRFPGNIEVCDDEGVDEDCDPDTFGERDDDEDGYVDALCCNGENCGNDCDDSEPSAHPSESEVCDGIDNDCSGEADDNIPASTFPRWYPDGDGDGARTMGVAGVQECLGEKPGYTLDVTEDCDDEDGSITPGAEELCDGKDNDCDPTTLGCVRHLLTGQVSQEVIGPFMFDVRAEIDYTCPPNMFLASVQSGVASCDPEICVMNFAASCSPLFVDEATGDAFFDVSDGHQINYSWNHDTSELEFSGSGPTNIPLIECSAGDAVVGVFDLLSTCGSTSIIDGALEIGGSTQCDEGDLPVGIKVAEASEMVTLYCSTVLLSE